MTDKNGLLTNAGKLMTDQHTVYNSRMFCTRWNGLEKGSIFDDALDDKEYEGNLIYLLKSGSEFIRNNSKVRFVKELQTEYAKLLEEKKETYSEYRRSREEMRELLTAKANVDRVLKMEVEQDVEKEKDHGQR